MDGQLVGCRALKCGAWGSRKVLISFVVKHTTSLPFGASKSVYTYSEVT